MTAQHAGERRQQAQPLSGRAIQQAVLAQALQHPTTLYPFAAGAVAATYGLCVAPFLGGALIALLVAGGAGLVSAGSFVWRYIVQGEGSARVMAQLAIQSEDRRRKDEEQQGLEELRSELGQVIEQAGWTVGRETLDQLASEYDLLRRALDAQDGLDPLARGRIERSATAAYRQGLSALSGAAELVRAIVGADEPRLRGELNELQSELVTLDPARRAGPAGTVKQQAIDVRLQQLDTLAQQAVDRDRLLNEACLAAAALQRAHGALGTLEWNVSADGVSQVTAGLDRAMEQTVRAQRSLSGDSEQRNEERTTDR